MHRNRGLAILREYLDHDDAYADSEMLATPTAASRQVKTQQKNDQQNHAFAEDNPPAAAALNSSQKTSATEQEEVMKDGKPFSDADTAPKTPRLKMDTTTLPMGGPVSPFSPLFNRKRPRVNWKDEAMEDLSLSICRKVSVVIVLRSQNSSKKICLFPPNEPPRSTHVSRELIVVNPTAFGNAIPPNITMDTARLAAEIADTADWARSYKFHQVVWPNQKTNAMENLTQALANDILAPGSIAQRLVVGYGTTVKGHGPHTKTMYGSVAKQSVVRAFASEESKFGDEVLERYGMLGLLASKVLPKLEKQEFSVSILEVVGQHQMYDLLLLRPYSSKNPIKVGLHHQEACAVVTGLSETQVDSAKHLGHLIRRAFSAALHPARKTPRGHFLTTLSLHDPSDPARRTACRFLDLACTEAPVNKKAVLTLGAVLRSLLLREAGNESPVSFRETLLTQALQKNLIQKDSRVVVLAAASTANSEYEKTMHTLRFMNHLLARPGDPVRSPFNGNKQHSQFPDGSTEENFTGQEGRLLQEVLSDPRQRLAKVIKSAKKERQQRQFQDSYIPRQYKDPDEDDSENLNITTENPLPGDSAFNQINDLNEESSASNPLQSTDDRRPNMSEFDDLNVGGTESEDIIHVGDNAETEPLDFGMDHRHQSVRVKSEFYSESLDEDDVPCEDCVMDQPSKSLNKPSGQTGGSVSGTHPFAAETGSDPISHGQQEVNERNGIEFHRNQGSLNVGEIDVANGDLVLDQPSFTKKEMFERTSELQNDKANDMGDQVSGNLPLGSPMVRGPITPPCADHGNNDHKEQSEFRRASLILEDDRAASGHRWKDQPSFTAKEKSESPSGLQEKDMTNPTGGQVSWNPVLDSDIFRGSITQHQQQEDFGHALIGHNETQVGQVPQMRTENNRDHVNDQATIGGIAKLNSGSAENTADQSCDTVTGNLLLDSLVREIEHEQDFLDRQTLQPRPSDPSDGIRDPELAASASHASVEDFDSSVGSMNEVDKSNYRYDLMEGGLIEGIDNLDDVLDVDPNSENFLDQVTAIPYSERYEKSDNRNRLPVKDTWKETCHRKHGDSGLLEIRSSSSVDHEIQSLAAGVDHLDQQLSELVMKETFEDQIASANDEICTKGQRCKEPSSDESHPKDQTMAREESFVEGTWAPEPKDEEHEIVSNLSSLIDDSNEVTTLERLLRCQGDDDDFDHETTGHMSLESLLYELHSTEEAKATACSQLQADLLVETSHMITDDGNEAVSDMRTNVTRIVLDLKEDFEHDATDSRSLDGVLRGLHTNDDKQEVQVDSQNFREAMMLGGAHGLTDVQNASVVDETRTPVASNASQGLLAGHVLGESRYELPPDSPSVSSEEGTPVISSQNQMWKVTSERDQLEEKHDTRQTEVRDCSGTDHIPGNHSELANTAMPKKPTPVGTSNEDCQESASMFPPSSNSRFKVGDNVHSGSSDLHFGGSLLDSLASYATKDDNVHAAARKSESYWEGMAGREKLQDSDWTATENSVPCGSSQETNVLTMDEPNNIYPERKGDSIGPGTRGLTVDDNAVSKFVVETKAPEVELPLELQIEATDAERNLGADCQEPQNEPLRTTESDTHKRLDGSSHTRGNNHFDFHNTQQPSLTMASRDHKTEVSLLANYGQPQKTSKAVKHTRDRDSAYDLLNNLTSGQSLNGANDNSGKTLLISSLPTRSIPKQPFTAEEMHHKVEADTLDQNYFPTTSSLEVNSGTGTPSHCQSERSETASRAHQEMNRFEDEETRPYQLDQSDTTGILPVATSTYHSKDDPNEKAFDQYGLLSHEHAQGYFETSYADNRRRPEENYRQAEDITQSRSSKGVQEKPSVDACLYEIDELEAAVDEVRRTNSSVWQASLASIENLRKFQASQKGAMMLLKRERDEAQEKARALEIQLRQMNENYLQSQHEKDVEVENLVIELSEVKAVRQEVVRIAEEAISTQAELEAKVVILQSKIQNSVPSEEYESLRRENDSNQKQFEAADEEASRMRSIVEEQKESIVDLKEKWSKKDSENRELELELSTARHNSGLLQRQVQSLSAKASSEETAFRRQVAALTEDLGAARNRIVNLEAENRRALELLEVTERSQFDKLTDLESQLSATKLEAASNNEQWEHDRQQLLTEIKTLSNQLADSRSRNSELEKELEEVRQDREGITQNLSQTEMALENRLTDISELSGAVELLLAQKEEDRQKVSEMEASLTSFREDTRSRVETVVRHRKEAAALLEKTMQENRSLETSNKALKKTVEELTEQLAAVEARRSRSPMIYENDLSYRHLNDSDRLPGSPRQTPSARQDNVAAAPTLGDTEDIMDLTARLALSAKYPTSQSLGSTREIYSTIYTLDDAKDDELIALKRRIKALERKNMII